uniref:WRKY domain-containing protein n=1 Tax=Kalanchoe fedtschenkoi TaxID=63787 RepID=A0A7N1A300_KALFE
MMKKEAMENPVSGARNPSDTSLFYSDLQGVGAGYGSLCSMFDGMGNGAGGELGFLEMLGVQEFQVPMGYVFDETAHSREVMPSWQTATSIDQVAAVGDIEYHNGSLKPMSKQRQQFDDGNNNAPGTPNSSSISSASNNEGVVVESDQQDKAEEDEEEEDIIGDEEEEEQDQQGSGKNKKQLKAKKANLKKQRQPRFAFMTKSEVDHLEDGYRWRKYGQKAVKNSPFPRSYYRCTSASCGVKKRVERSCTDPSIVVTTYEGQHTHPSPLTPRSISSSIFPDSAAFAAMPALMQMNLHSRYQQQLPSYFASPLNYSTYPIHSLTTSPAPNFNSFTPSPKNNLNLMSNPDQTFLRDHGLLQDLIPSLLPKEEQQRSSN